MNRQCSQATLPLYGLDAPFSGDRLIEGEGRDVYTVIHRPDNAQGELTVGTIRRATAFSGKAKPPTAISEECVRANVARALVVDLPTTGADVFEKAAKLAQDADVWTVRDIRVDGERVVGHETTYEGMWIVYRAMPDVILYVSAPITVCLTTIEVRKFQAGEIPRRQDWTE